MKRYTGTLLALGALLALALQAQPPRQVAQLGPIATGTTVGILNDIHAVQDLEKTLKFYQDVFGLTGNIQDFPNPGVPLLTNAPGVSLRLVVMNLPDAAFFFEFTDFTGVEKVARRAKPSDPGAAYLKLYVRNMDAIAAAAKAAGAEIVTAGGAPVTVGGNPSLVLRDPDGYFVEAIQTPAAAGAPEGKVHSVGIGMVMASADTTQNFYRGYLGFDLKGENGFKSDAAMMQLWGLPEATEYRRLTGVVPGDNAPIEFTEYRGVEREKFHLRVRDPGAPAMGIQVNNLDAVLAKMRADGVNVMSLNGEVVQFSATVRNIFVEDPSGVNIELYESTAPPGGKGKAKGKAK